MHVPLHCLLVPPNIPAGMNPLVLMSLAYKFRSTHEDVEPIEIMEWGNNGLYRIIDGKHRFMASVIAGRTTVWAKVTTNDVDNWTW